MTRNVIIALLIAPALAAPALAAPGQVAYALGGEDRESVASDAEARLGEAAYVLGVSPVHTRDLHVEGDVVRIRVQFQSGESWTHDQRVSGTQAGMHVIEPGDLPYGIEFPEDAAYLRVTSPPGASGAEHARVAEDLAQKLGLPPADASAWTPGESAGHERVLSHAGPPEGGFVLDCADCRVLVRQGEGTARTLNHARALFHGDDLVLFETTPWVDLDAAGVLSGGDAAAQAESHLRGQGYAAEGLQARWLTLEGDRLLYELVPTGQANVTSVFADAFTGEVVRVNGPPSAVTTGTHGAGAGSGAAGPGASGGTDVQENAGDAQPRGVPGPAAALVAVALAGVALARRR